MLNAKFKLFFIPVTIDKTAIYRQLPQGQMRAPNASAAQMETEMPNIYLLSGSEKEMDSTQGIAG